MIRKPFKQPMTRAGWANYYIKRWCRSGHSHAEQLALWYLLLDEEDA